MFTGLIQQIGTIIHFTSGSTAIMTIETHQPHEWNLGDSIACDGICLTIASMPTAKQLVFHLSPETLIHSHFSMDSLQKACHLEPALKAGDPLGGHFVTGHVHGLACITQLNHLQDCCEMTLEYLGLPESIVWHPKGSLTVDGVSLTINQIHQNSCQLMLIPHTLTHTHFHAAQINQQVHIEFDLLETMIAHQVQNHLTGHTV